MPNMFKLMENELDMVHSSFSKTHAYVTNVETFAEYILEDDDRHKYTKEMVEIIEDVHERISIMFDKITTEQEYIEKIKDKIVKLY